MIYHRKLRFLVLVLVAFFMLGSVFAVAGGHKVNINTADMAQLMTLKHVGEKLAQRIIEYREKNPFRTPEEIMQVKGIGSKVYEANKNKIIVIEGN